VTSIILLGHALAAYLYFWLLTKFDSGFSHWTILFTGMFAIVGIY
jgi:hypothetical protein